MKRLSRTSATQTLSAETLRARLGGELCRLLIGAMMCRHGAARQAMGTHRAAAVMKHECDEPGGILMGRMKLVTAAACATLLLGAAGAAAQTSDRTTYVTFSGPVSIPGKTLPAGTYTFRLADSPADRHIVHIFDREQSQLLATLLAVPAERNQPEGEPVITFKETPSNLPPALRYWYYAGETAGNEFVYPKAQAMTIARASGEGVMAVDTDSTNVQDWKGTPERVTASAEPQSATTAATGSTSSAGTTASTATTTDPTTTSAAQPTT